MMWVCEHERFGAVVRKKRKRKEKEKKEEKEKDVRGLEEADVSL